MGAIPKVNFKKLKIKFADKLRQDWVGDWDARKNEIMIHTSLNGIDRIGVVVHEFIEMTSSAVMGIPDCCDPSYRARRHDRKNGIAHNIADSVEKRIIELAGYSWLAHQRRCRKLSKEIREKKEDFNK